MSYTIATVECSLTVDDRVVKVLYNDQELEVQGGKLDRWQAMKTITFESCDSWNPGQLSIKGEDVNKKLNCVFGGLMLHCTASDTNSPWHNFKSDNIHWTDENGKKPCQNNVGIYSLPQPTCSKLREKGAKKIWAPRQTVTLIGTPPESGIDIIHELQVVM